MSGIQQIHLKTANGELVFTQHPGEPSACTFCPTISTEVVAIRSVAGEQPGAPAREFEGHICGDCLAKGLAISAGNTYVSADGDVDNLRFDGHIFTTSEICDRCGRSRLAIEKSGDTCGGRAV